MSIDLDRITHPLQLASGSHQAGSGRGCAMNVISWIMGEPKISDFPECSERLLALMVQTVNDRAANIPVFGEPTATGGMTITAYLLSPEDSFLALDLAWLTVGTAGQPIEVLAVWMKRIVHEASMRFHEDLDAVLALADAQRLLNDGKPEDALTYISDAASVGGELVGFTDYAIRKFRDIAGLDEAADADPVVVNEAIERMVTV